MAEVTAALDTLSDAAICGSDGSRILVASVPVAGKRREHRDLQEGRGDFRERGGVDRTAVWSAMEAPGNDMK